MEVFMRIALIGCMVLSRPISYLAAQSANTVRTWWLRQNFHNTPELLHLELQKLIREIEEENVRLLPHERFDAVVLAYGLCSNSVIGLRSLTLPLVIPRCDDCITLFLGSAERYQTYFRDYPGTFWYTTGWIEHGDPPSRARYQRERAEYAEKYGEDNADYLMECSSQWLSNYRHCGYITSPLGDFSEHIAFTRQAAEDFGWSYQEFQGDLKYLTALVNGPWDDDRFLISPPQSRVAAEYSPRKFCSIPCQPEQPAAPEPQKDFPPDAEEKIVQKHRKGLQDKIVEND